MSHGSQVRQNLDMDYQCTATANQCTAAVVDGSAHYHVQQMRNAEEWFACDNCEERRPRNAFASCYTCGRWMCTATCLDWMDGINKSRGYWVCSRCWDLRLSMDPRSDWLPLRPLEFQTDDAVAKGLEEKSKEFRDSGAEIYQKV